MRIRALVTDHTGDWLFARHDRSLTSYYVNWSGMQLSHRDHWFSLVPGSIIELTPIDHPKGPRGIEVSVVKLAPASTRTTRTADLVDGL